MLKPEITTAKGASPSDHGGCCRHPSPARARSTRSSPLALGYRALLMGDDRRPAAEPVAWVNSWATSRVFYTSLGHPGDFENTAVPHACCATPSSGHSNRQPSGGARAPRPPSRASGPERSHAPLLIEARARAHARAGPGRVQGSRRSPDRPGPGRAGRPPAGLDLSFDERGRLWVVQYLQYPVPGRAQDGQPRRRLARRLRQGPPCPAPPLPRQGQDHDP